MLLASRRACFPSLAALLLTTACGGGGGGDAPSKPVKSVLGTGSASATSSVRPTVRCQDVNSVSCSTPRQDGAPSPASPSWRSIASTRSRKARSATSNPGNDEGAERVRRHHRVRRRVHAPGLRVAPATCSTLRHLHRVHRPFERRVRSARRSRSAHRTVPLRRQPHARREIDFQELFGYRTRAVTWACSPPVENVKVGAGPRLQRHDAPTGGRYNRRHRSHRIDTTGVDQRLPEDFERAQTPDKGRRSRRAPRSRA